MLTDGPATIKLQYCCKLVANYSAVVASCDGWMFVLVFADG